MQAWEDFLKKQETLLGRPIVEKWLRPLKVVHFDSGNLYLEAKDSFQVLWFEEHIRPQLKSQLLNNNFRPVKSISQLPNQHRPLPLLNPLKKKKQRPIPLSFHLR